MGIFMSHVFPFVMAEVGKRKGIWKKINMCDDRCKDTGGFITSIFYICS